MITPGCLMWHVVDGSCGDVNDIPYLILKVNELDKTDPTESGMVEFVCLESADRFHLSFRMIGRLVRDRLAYFTGHDGAATGPDRQDPLGSDGEGHIAEALPLY